MRLVAKMLENPALESPQDLAAAYSQLLRESLEWWLATDRVKSEEPTAADRCAVVNAWLAASGGATGRGRRTAKRCRTRGYAEVCRSVGIDSLDAGRHCCAVARAAPIARHGRRHP